MRFGSLCLACLLLLIFTAAPVAAKSSPTTSSVHVVKQGDTLYEIASRHGLTVKEIKRLNGLNSTRLKIGQKLALTRAAAPPGPQSARKAAATTKQGSKGQQAVGSTETYLVKRGDSLYTIARRHSLTVNQLKQLNGLTGNHLKTGQRLALSGVAPDEPVTAKSAQRAATETHVVKKGESLYSIARRHDMSIDDLKRINDLTGSRLKIGQRLALASRDHEPSPLLLPGDVGENEVLQLTDSGTSELEQAAFEFLATPYRFGGNSRKGIDCSAFVQQVFREVDVKLPRSAREQFRIGEKVERSDLQAGDLLFFRTYAKFPSHVGIYLGDGKMIHASSRSRRVVVTDIDFPYYSKRFIGAKRITLLDSETDGTTLKSRDEDVDLAAPVESTLPSQPVDPAPLKSAGPADQLEVTSASVN